MKKNIWETIANQYGIPLDREFTIEEYGTTAVYTFTKNGLKRTDRKEQPALIILAKLLNGELSVVPKLWKPEVGDTYWIVNTLSNGALFTESSIWNEDMTDFCRYYCENCFKTREEAQAQSVEVYAKLTKYYNKKED